MQSDLSKTGLSQETIDKIRGVFQKYPKIEQVILYGSRAKGNYQNGSDIDLTVVGDNLDSSQLMKIENELDDLLLPYTIDLCLFGEIQNSALIEHIERVGTDFYQR